MPSCPIPRVSRVFEGVRQALDRHERECGDRVSAVALHPDDHAHLSIAELWGIPVLAWDAVNPGNLRLLCDANGILILQVQTVDELLEHWAYRCGAAEGLIAG